MEKQYYELISVIEDRQGRAANQQSAHVQSDAIGNNYAASLPVIRPRLQCLWLGDQLGLECSPQPMNSGLVAQLMQ